MPTRRPAGTATADETETPTEEKIEKSDLVAAVREVISDLGIGTIIKETEDGVTEGEDGTEKIESPRVTEAKTESAVRNALEGLSVHIHNGEKEEAPKKEPENAPGGDRWLTRLIWGKQK